jgi:hypothetical protein
VKSLEGVGLYKIENGILGSFEKVLKSGHQVPYKLGYFFITFHLNPSPDSTETPTPKIFSKIFLPPLYKVAPSAPTRHHSAPSNSLAPSYNSALKFSHTRLPQRACKFLKIGFLLEGKGKGQKFFPKIFRPLYIRSEYTLC